LTDIERDLLIVGAGPVGLYAAYYAGPLPAGDGRLGRAAEPGE
jgi:threonine dehydrogenase-like Zn-dependent dehydrogenase